MKLFNIITTSLLGFAMAIGAGVAINNNQVEKTEAATSTLTIDASDLPGSSYANNNGEHTKDGIKWFSNQAMKQGSDIQFQKEFETLVHHINRIVCYQKKNDIRPKDIGIYVNAHKRMKNKFYKLKKLEEKKNKFLTIESALKSNINEKVNKLLFKIHY